MRFVLPEASGPPPVLRGAINHRNTGAGSPPAFTSCTTRNSASCTGPAADLLELLLRRPPPFSDVSHPLCGGDCFAGSTFSFKLRLVFNQISMTSVRPHIPESAPGIPFVTAARRANAAFCLFEVPLATSNFRRPHGVELPWLKTFIRVPRSGRLSPFCEVTSFVR